MKFGGTSVGMTTGLSQLLSIVLYEHERWSSIVLVVSALEGVTDALIEAAHLAQLNNQRGYRRIVATLRTRHLALIEHLPLGATEKGVLQTDLDRLLYDLLDVCQIVSERHDDSLKPEIADKIVHVGERLAARIVAALLRQNNLRGVALDATDLVITNNVYGNATPDLSLTRERIAQNLLPLLQRGIIPVVTGYIGSSVTGNPTTLGRGGSDYTASILGAGVDAQEVWVWTDVEGLMTTDPREIDIARVIPSLSYEEAAELAYFGARILHPRMVQPLRAAGIPLRVRNVYTPQQTGTLVRERGGGMSPAIRAVTSINGLGMSAPRSGSLGALAEIVDNRLAEITGSRTDVTISSQSSAQSFICFVIPTSAGPDALHSLQVALSQDAAAEGWQMRPVQIVTVIGTRLGEVHPLTADVLLSLEGIPLLALSQGPSHCSLSLVVETDYAEAALTRIHNLILKSS